MMAMLQRVIFHLTAFFTFGNGLWLIMRWMEDANPYKDGFILVVGIITLIIGLLGFVLSFMKFDKKDV